MQGMVIGKALFAQLISLQSFLVKLHIPISNGFDLLVSFLWLLLQLKVLTDGTRERISWLLWSSASAASLTVEATGEIVYGVLMSLTPSDSLLLWYISVTRGCDLFGEEKWLLKHWPKKVHIMAYLELCCWRVPVPLLLLPGCVCSQLWHHWATHSQSRCFGPHGCHCSTW